MARWESSPRRLPKTRKALREFPRRLACRVSGHDWSEWEEVRHWMVFEESQLVDRVAEERHCRRMCGLPGYFEDRVR
jgi:hypothetical protein